MTQFKFLIEKANKQLNNKLPFTLFNLPDSPTIKCYFQLNDTLLPTVDFSEDGFVFAPFNLEDTTILFKTEHCEVLETPFSFSQSFSKASDVRTLEDKKAKGAHIKLVSDAVETIKQTDLSKVVLSRPFRHSTEKSALVLFEELLQLYPSAFTYIWYHPKVGLWLGATPETLFQLNGQHFKTVALAGTKTDDKLLEDWGTKEIDEQEIVTTTIKKALSPYARSITISEVETVKAGNILHLKTNLEGFLKPNTKLSAILSSLHPTPAVCGYPKDLAYSYITEKESYDRSFYTGFLGEINSGDINKNNTENLAYRKQRLSTKLFVNLRCLSMLDDTVTIFVGGGITAESNPELEFIETVRKSETMLRAL